MIKPLLSVPVSLTGNVKIQNFVNITRDTSDDTFSKYYGNVREARLVPVSSGYSYGNFSCNLLNSKYSFDICKYYSNNKDIFFKNGNEKLFDNVSIPMEKDYPESNRVSDFEWGMKRISYQKNHGCTHSFFAPIWIDENNIPDYFRITVKITPFTNISSLVKTKYIYIPLKTGLVSLSENYLPTYLNNYLKNIDTKVARLDYDYLTGYFWGISLKNGDFVQVKDTVVSEIWSRQMAVNDFDFKIVDSFKRNNIICKQILPLSFSLNFEDVLIGNQSDISNTIQVSGAYINVINDVDVPLDIYNFNYNYVNDRIKYKGYNSISNEFVTKLSNNIFTSFDNSKSTFNDLFNLSEGNYYNFTYSNKLSPYYFKWKLSVSPDDYPYILNLSENYNYSDSTSYNFGKYYSILDIKRYLPFMKLPVVSSITGNTISFSDALKKDFDNLKIEYYNNFKNTWFYYLGRIGTGTWLCRMEY
jgi:hypothetical protein